MIKLKTLPFWLGLLICFTPAINSPIALILGFLITSFGLVPHNIAVTKITKKLLAYSIVGLGFGIPLQQALTVTANGIGLVMSTIVGTLLLGTIIASWIGLDRKSGHLIASGTAICGGSAIAAVAPAIDAKDEQIGVALGTVFVLNSVALFLFPLIGHALHLDQHTFGTWAAIAIHDTSSVVGAASAYGAEALKTATTLKLARALWIVPVAFVSAWLFRSESKKVTIPYFIIFYCIAIGITALFPQGQTLYHGIFLLSKQALVVCLYLIGCGISVARLKQSGPRPFIFGVILWGLISGSSLLWLLNHPL
ncbi:YeiH family protein [Vibrio palustris]|uniref:Sulfate exporter family transporter n=1 Tax=Vibrio palustris TaxID=1918946 RepID=A0A1R4B3F5_9VIBR|nr:putative sulfate exporter family transporter [Vibrio palustris]SJL83431.1 hypothetical protein VPAL9027_01399 [Vibrio palustris]